MMDELSIEVPDKSIKAAYLGFCSNCARRCHALFEDKLQAVRTNLGFSVEGGVLFHV